MLVVSAPFGNYIQPRGCLPTLGTFTVHKRHGRWRRVLQTVRYSWKLQGWINKIGLRNPGMSAIPPARNALVSLHGFNQAEWIRLVEETDCPLVELNLSCPNVRSKPQIHEPTLAVKLALKSKQLLVCKLPPVRWMDWVLPLRDLGVTHFHACNTIPTPGGGLSGKTLMNYSLWATEEIKALGGTTVISGGGVTEEEDVISYRNAGADHVAIGSMLLNPFNWRKIPKLAIQAGSTTINLGE